MLTLDTPALFHIVGYLTGAILYTMLFTMTLRTAGRRDRLTLGTALLGIAWNVGELTAHGLDMLGLPVARDWMSAASYAALGVLAAMVVHSVSRVRLPDDVQTGPTASRALAAIAYGCAGVAGAMQFVAAGRGSTLPSPAALVLVTSGFLVLIPLLAFATRRHAHSRRALWMAALAAFAVSALHLANFHGANESPVTELLGHHASIPLAFAILYQDYRFALADLFLKRALTLLLLVSFILVAWSGLAPAFVTGSPAPAAVGTLLVLWALTALLFPVLHRAATAFVDRVVLMRANYTAFVESLASALQGSDSEHAVLKRTCDALAPTLSATAVTWEPRDLVSPAGLAAHEIGVLTADTPQYVLVVGALAGGRRLLSGDLAMLERVAFLIARRIDALRLSHERYERMLRDREMRTLATEAELRTLRAQVNPHFLFNALTTMAYLIQNAPARALDTLLRLTTLLRGVLKSEGQFTTLGHERELIACYLQIERERFEERLDVDIDIPDDLADIPIPALIVQPLVENAIKHGIAKARHGGLVSVSARRDGVEAGGDLVIVVRNTGAPVQDGPAGPGVRIGLRNVERRLTCYYGGRAALALRSETDGTTVAELRMPASNVEENTVAVVSRGTGP